MPPNGRDCLRTNPVLREVEPRDGERQVLGTPVALLDPAVPEAHRIFKL